MRPSAVLAAQGRAPVPDDSVALQHERVEKFANAAIVAIPFGLLCWAVWLAWGGVLGWQDLLVLAIMYLLTGTGVTVRRWEVDPSALLITALERVGLAWDVVRIAPERQAARIDQPASRKRTTPPNVPA